MIREHRGALHSAALAAGLLMTSLLASCGTTTAPEPAPTAAPKPAEDVCWEIVDVGTLVLNMQAGRDADRIGNLDFRGAMQLASRMVSRLEPPEDPDLDVAVDALKAAAGEAGVDPYSSEWTTAFNAAKESCGSILGEFGTYGWVGG